MRIIIIIIIILPYYLFKGGGDTSLLAIRSVDQQRNNLSAKTVTSLSNGRRWDRQLTGLLPMNGAFHGIEKTRVIKAYNISVCGIDFSSD